LVKLSAVEGILLGDLGALAFIWSDHTHQVYGIDVQVFALLMVVSLGLIMPLRPKVQDRRLARRPFKLFSFILLYATLTVFTGSQRNVSTQTLVSPLVLAFLAMVVPYKLTGLIESIRTKPQQSIFRLSLLITVSLSIYATKVQSDTTASSRLASPLGGASVVHVGLLLTLAAYIACAKSGYRRVLSLGLAVLTITLIILTGSRAGVASALLLGFLMTLDARHPGRSAAVFASTGVVFTALLKILPANRFDSAVDTLRGDNLLSALHLLHNSSVANIIFGLGSGRVWPWYGYENGSINFAPNGLSINFAPNGLVPTDFGYLLTNPHSVILGTMVELGLVGFTALLLIFLAIFRGYRNSKRLPDSDFLSTLFLGILCTLPSFVVDYYLYKNFPSAFIWWYFVFFALTLSGYTQGHLDKLQEQQISQNQPLRRHGGAMNSPSSVRP
jgi:hypothetical protein